MRLLVLTSKMIFMHRSRILKRGVLSSVTAAALPLCHCRSMAMGGGCRSPGNMLYFLCPMILAFHHSKSASLGLLSFTKPHR